MKRRPPTSLVAALVGKRWDLLDEYKRRAVRVRKSLGLGEALRVSSELRALMKYWNPAWPSPQDREEDLETHRRVARALATTAPSVAPDRNRSEGRKTPPRVRSARQARKASVVPVRRAGGRSARRPALDG